MSNIYYGNLYDKSDKSSDKPIAINSCGICKDKEFRTLRERGRDDHLLIYMADGELEICENGVVYPLLEGQIAIIPPHVPHDYTQHMGTYYYVHFSGTAVPEMLATIGVSEFCIRDVSDRNSLKNLLERLLFDFDTRPKESLYPLGDLLHIFDAINKPSTVTCDERLREIILYLHKNYANDIDLEKMASSVNLSVGRFIKAFKNSTGFTPHAYLLNLRLFFAREMLVNTDLAIYQIASAVGFDDAFYFSRLFKSKYKVSPRAFRSK